MTQILRPIAWHPPGGHRPNLDMSYSETVNGDRTEVRANGRAMSLPTEVLEEIKSRGWVILPLVKRRTREHPLFKCRPLK